FVGHHSLHAIVPSIGFSRNHSVLQHKSISRTGFCNMSSPSAASRSAQSDECSRLRLLPTKLLFQLISPPPSLPAAAGFAASVPTLPAATSWAARVLLPAC